MAPRSAVFGVLLRVLFCVLFYGVFNVVVVGLGVWWLCVVVDICVCGCGLGVGGGVDNFGWGCVLWWCVGVWFHVERCVWWWCVSGVCLASGVWVVFVVWCVSGVWCV